MNKKFNLYLIFFVGVLAVAGIGLVAFTSAQKLFIKAETKYNPLENPGVDAGDNHVTISWRSRNRVLSMIKFGTKPEALVIPTFDSKETTDHKVTISSVLLPNTTYFYRIYTDKEIYPPLAQNPLSFTTLAAQNPQTPYPPCLLTVFESYYNSRPGDGKFSAAYDLYPVGKPDGTITYQDYLQCLNKNPLPTP